MRLTIVRKYLVLMSAPGHSECSGSEVDAGVVQLYIV